MCLVRLRLSTFLRRVHLDKFLRRHLSSLTSAPATRAVFKTSRFRFTRACHLCNLLHMGMSRDWCEAGITDIYVSLGYPWNVLVPKKECHRPSGLREKKTN